MRLGIFCWLLALLALGACAAPVPTAPPPPAAQAQPQPCVQEGLASWYAPHRGQIRTADGGRLNSVSLTAAHRFLPFGTRVRVTDLASGRSVVVRITDRGPYPRGRVIDVSPAAARVLAMRHAGLVPVRLELDGADDSFCVLRDAAGWSSWSGTPPYATGVPGFPRARLIAWPHAGPAMAGREPRPGYPRGF